MAGLRLLDAVHRERPDGVCREAARAGSAMVSFESTMGSTERLARRIASAAQPGNLRIPPAPRRRATIGRMAVHASITPYLSAGDRCRPVFFAGPCVIESRAHTLKMAKAIKAVFEGLGVADRLVFKASFDKANRSAATRPAGQESRRGWTSSLR